MMEERDWIDKQDAASIGDTASKKGSLTGLLITRYGTESPALDDRDWELLDEWFRKGMPTGEHVSR